MLLTGASLAAADLQKDQSALSGKLASIPPQSQPLSPCVEKGLLSRLSPLLRSSVLRPGRQMVLACLRSLKCDRLANSSLILSKPSARFRQLVEAAFRSPAVDPQSKCLFPQLSHFLRLSRLSIPSTLSLRQAHVKSNE